MMYSGPGVLAPLYDLAPPSPVSKLDRQHTGRLRKRDNSYATGEGEKGGGGAKSCDRKEVWSSINNPILSGCDYTNFTVDLSDQGGRARADFSLAWLEAA